jgi:hypothetical protein
MPDHHPLWLLLLTAEVGRHVKSEVLARTERGGGGQNYQ